MKDVKDLPLSFWQALSEHVPRLLLGNAVVDSWRAEDAKRKELERIQHKHMDEARRLMTDK